MGGSRSLLQGLLLRDFRVQALRRGEVVEVDRIPPELLHQQRSMGTAVVDSQVLMPEKEHANRPWRPIS